ncbi:hypothetical protein HaLaN_32569, partial [Haematococcus lacustris]
MMLAAAGDCSGAVQLANQEVAGGAHDSLAAALQCSEGLRGAQLALGLTGLSLAASK